MDKKIVCSESELREAIKIEAKEVLLSLHDYDLPYLESLLSQIIGGVLIRILCRSSDS